MIRILLVDDQALLCEVLKTWLEVEEDFQVVGVAHNGREALEKVEMLQPDIVLMDIDMPEMNGLNATKLICERFPHVKVIFLSGHDDDTYLGKSLRAGAKGYLLKNTTAEELSEKIRFVHKNVNLLEPEDRTSVVSWQTQLEELIETYRHRFQKQLEENRLALEKTISWEELDQKYERRLGELERSFRENQGKNLSELEYKNKSSWESIRQELLNVNAQFNEANRNLSTQFNQQIVNLRKDLDTQLAVALDDWSRQRAALQEWAVQRDEMRPSMDDYESKYRNELMSVVNPIRSSFRDVDRQMRMLRNLAIASILTAVVAVSFASWLFVSKLRTDNNPPPPNTQGKVSDS
jgi:YesN/AraC family two-component response regulator